MIKRVLLLMGSLVLAAPGESLSDDGNMHQVPSDFFGIHCNYCSSPAPFGAPSTPFPQLGERAIRLWDAGVDWASVEKSRGTYDWSRLDQRVNRDKQLGLATMLTFGFTPKWCSSVSVDNKKYIFYPPSDMACWSEYIQAVTKRYGDSIQYYGLWNEPNGGGWAGTSKELVELSRVAFQIIKTNAPKSLVMSPEFTDGFSHSGTVDGALGTFLSNGGGKYFDALAMHFYAGDGRLAEDSISKIKGVRTLLDNVGLQHVAIYDTEDGTRGWRDEARKMRNVESTGFNDPLPTSQKVGDQEVNLQASYITRQYLVTLSTGLIKQSYYYNYDNPIPQHGVRSVMAIHMIDYPKNPSRSFPPAQAYRYIASLLPKGWVSDIHRMNGYWQMSFKTVGGKAGRVYWCSDFEKASVTDENVVRAMNNLGDPLPLAKMFDVTASPIFVFYS